MSAATNANTAKVDAKKEPAKENMSFMANIFRGNLQSAQVFPYPDVLTTDEKEMTASLIDPFEKFFLVSKMPNSGLSPISDT